MRLHLKAQNYASPTAALGNRKAPHAKGASPKTTPKTAMKRRCEISENRKAALEKCKPAFSPAEGQARTFLRFSCFFSEFPFFQIPL